MNKTYTYSLIALAILAVVMIGSAVFLGGPEVASVVSLVPEGSQGAAAAQTIGVRVGQSQKIAWNAADYSSSQVSIKLIRKTGDNPARYEVVRVLSPAIANTGSASWTPISADAGSNIFVEIGCVSPTGACRSAISPVSFSVSN